MDIETEFEYTHSNCMELIKIIQDLFSNKNIDIDIHDFSEYIDALLENIDKEKCVEAFSLCKCCDNHQINRPKKYEPFIEIEFHNTQKNMCSCQCRHLSRHICRTFK